MNILGFEIPIELVTFVFGLAVSFALFFLKWAYATKEYCNFKLMIKSEYVVPETIQGITTEDAKESYEKATFKVDYLIKNKLNSLGYINQFKFLRVAEFTKIYFENSIEIIEQYPFKDLDAEKLEVQLLETKALQKILPKLIYLYNERVSDYVSMKRDSFLTSEELLNLKKNIWICCIQ